jgi:hypothetical protein
MKKIVLLFGLLMSGLHGLNANAQCSDAGVCNVGEHSIDNNFSSVLDYRLGFSGNPDNITIHDLELSLAYSIVHVNVPFVAKSYSNSTGQGSNSGIGDVTAGVSVPFYFNRDPYTDRYSQGEGLLSQATNSTLTFEAGMKFPTGSYINDTAKQRYETGLGTYNLIVGATFSLPHYKDISEGDWQFGMGFLLPIITYNSLEEDIGRVYNGSSLAAKIRYGRWFDEQLRISAEAIGIQQVTETTVHAYLVTESSPEPIGIGNFPIEGTDQLQINIKLSGDYRLTDDIGLQAWMAIPILERNSNLDGLKRSFTFSLGLYYPN